MTLVPCARVCARADDAFGRLLATLTADAAFCAAFNAALQAHLSSTFALREEDTGAACAAVHAAIAAELACHDPPAAYYSAIDDLSFEVMHGEPVDIARGIDAILREACVAEGAGRDGAWRARFDAGLLVALRAPLHGATGHDAYDDLELAPPAFLMVGKRDLLRRFVAEAGPVALSALAEWRWYGCVATRAWDAAGEVVLGADMVQTADGVWLAGDAVVCRAGSRFRAVRTAHLLLHAFARWFSCDALVSAHAVSTPTGRTGVSAHTADQRVTYWESLLERRGRTPSATEHDSDTAEPPSKCARTGCSSA